jgi:dihydrofolate reductase
VRKIIVLEHISLDGVIQAPGGPEEDPSGGFAYGGWSAPYSDPTLGAILEKVMNLPFDLLLGRKTFDIWEPYWPRHADIWPPVMKVTKYVASNTRTSSEWQPSVFLNGDIAGKLAALKKQDGPDLHVWGSGDLIQTLLKHDLIDTFWLMIYPLTLGSGKKLFAEGAMPMAFKVTESLVTPIGVIVAKYERAGAVTTGSYLT